MKSLARSHVFVILLFSFYLNPYTLLIITSPQARAFLFFDTMVLAVWLWISWDRIRSCEYRARVPEIFIGTTLVAVAFVANLPFLRISSSFGILDMFLVFGGLLFVFYGVRGIKSLSIPALFFIIMISVSEIESVIDPVRNFEYLLLGAWEGSFGASLGIDVEAFADVVKVTVSDRSYFAQLDGPLRGIRGIIAYGALASIMLVAPRAPLRRKLLFASLAVWVTYLFSIARVGLILLAIGVIGIDGGLALQNYLGYIILTGWIIFFKFFAMPLLKGKSPLLRENERVSSWNALISGRLSKCRLQLTHTPKIVRGEDSGFANS